MLDVSFQLQIFSSSLYGKSDVKHENSNAKISSDIHIASGAQISFYNIESDWLAGMVLRHNGAIINIWNEH